VQLAATLAVCALSGLVSCALAASVSVRQGLMPALRSE
jgi:hypothetical protein